MDVRNGSARLPWLPGRASAVALAIVAWLSQLPYFMWDHRRLALLGGGVMAGAFALARWWDRRHSRFAKRDVFVALALILFLVYITAEPTTSGGHTYWVFIVPTVLALFISHQRERQLAYGTFEALFALSLIPGLILLALMIIGVPLTFNARPALNPVFAAAGVRILQGPGAIFIESNSQALPWGGVISRLCGVYDEPGMVGTITALMLAVRGFDIRGWRAVVLWLGGVFSLSLAFVVLTLAGVTARIWLAREWRPIGFAVPVLAAGMFAIGAWRPAAPAVPPTQITIRTNGTAVVPANVNREVRQTAIVNNRSLPAMQVLIARYEHSAWKTRIFGIASDASVVHGGVSTVWTRILTDHGLLGFTLLIAAFAGYGLSSLSRARSISVTLLFFGCYWLSFYQRPVIWMPYSLLLYFGALAILERRATNPADVGIWQEQTVPGVNERVAQRH
jgi:hypothetical protein